MIISIFYSWQSELSQDINHYFIRDSLKDAMRTIQRDLNLDERPQVDHDTKNTPGSPDIVATIFSKITASSAFVADVSFTSRSNTGRLCANANVLIELGFAMNALGDERLILVMNDAFGSPKDQMPFNLAARRWPITYTLSPGSERSERKQALQELSAKLAQSLKVMAENNILFSHPTTTSSVLTDRLLFKELLNVFPPNGTIARFLRDHDVKGKIYGKWWDELEDFINTWDKVTYEFTDPELDEKRRLLVNKLRNFSNTLALHVYPVKLGSSLEECYRMDLKHLTDFDHPLHQQAEKLNAMATEGYEVYEDLIRACKYKLGIADN